MKNLLKLFLVLTLVFGLSSMASAYNATFFGEDLGLGESTPRTTWTNASNAEAQFKANLVGVGTETFEGFDTGTSAPLALVFTGAGTANLTGGMSVATGANSVGRYPISGDNYLAGSSSAFTVSFTNPVAAFGFYGIDIGDFNGQITVNFVKGGTTNYTILNTVGGAGGSVLFWGLIDTDNPFTSLTFGNTAAGTDFFGFDDMTIGSVEQVKPTPEPTTMLLLGLGVLGLAGLRKRD